ncbi:MAG TPA: hypothetical protein VD913_01000 [bacterium]|nr:hypothetical protein [bacterium]
MLCLGAGLLYFFSGKLLKAATLTALDYFETHGESFGLKIQDPRFADASLCGIPSVCWKEFKFSVILEAKGGFSRERHFDLELNRLEIRPENFPPRRWRLIARGVRVFFDHFEDPSMRSAAKIREQVAGNYLTMQIPLDVTSLSGMNEQIYEILADVAGLFDEGYSRLLTHFEGSSTFSLNGRVYTPSIGMAREDGVSYLLMDRETLKMISGHLEEKLTVSETNLLSRNPVRVPRLLRIRNYAQKTSQEAHQKNPRVSEDAYRHVLWSYLLTKEFGAEFAQEVTDAHEIGDVEGEKAADHKMDYNNNAVGRLYALADYSEASILDRVLTDPEVIRSAEAISV